jgi:hypothetical protein
MKRIIGIICILIATLSGHAKEYSDILFIGNSITLVGIQETGFGMAASSAENDYVHKLLSMINSRQGYLPNKRAYNVCNFEENYNKIDLFEYFSFTDGFNPGLIVIELGDNVNADSALKNNFQIYYENMIILLAHKHPNADIVALTKFWNNITIDAIIINTVKSLYEAGYNIKCADISSLSGIAENHALSERDFENYGDGAHPGDRGMLHIAEIVFSTIYVNSMDVKEVKRIFNTELASMNTFPNPFNESTTIEFTVKNDNHTTLIIYDVLGRETETLFDEFALRGSKYRLYLNARNLPSGQYFCILKSGNSFSKKRISIIR